MTKRKVILIILAILGICSLSAKVISQEWVETSVEVGDTKLVISGKAFPEAFITILENGVVIGTAVADIQGSFYKELFAQENGSRLIGLYAVDKDSRTTATATYALDLVSGIDNRLEDVVLPPTVYISNQEVVQGDIVDIAGYAPPAATVSIFVNDELSGQVTADTFGYYLYQYDSKVRPPGMVEIYLKIQVVDVISQPTEMLTLTINAAPTPTPTMVPTATPSPTMIPTATPTFSPATTLTPTAQSATSVPTTAEMPTVTPVPSTPTPSTYLLPAFLRPFDINHDERLIIDEFWPSAELWIQFWHQFLAALKEKGLSVMQTHYNCDLNNDNVCDLVDFSILLYYIGR